jgi:mannose-6-phosphate isomerase
MCSATLPLWAARGWDTRHGGFVDRLDVDGTPDLQSPRRLRVQARQIFCFAQAGLLGWHADGHAIALRGLDYLLTKAKSPDGRPGYVSLGADGTMQGSERDTYDHAFVLLALSAVYQLNRDAQVRAEIDSVLEFLDRELMSEHGGYREGIPSILPRRQNPHMHLFEAMIALFNVTNDAVFLKRAGECFRLFVTHFYDAQTGAIAEYFEDDWARIAPVILEPGHHAEWVWLLKAFERLSGCPTRHFRVALLRSALRYRDPSTGCLVDEGNIDGTIRKFSRRCWPQAELVKAFVAEAEAGDDVAVSEARAALQRLELHYLRHPVRGAWYEHFDSDGGLLVETIPASSLYHILGAVVEADRVLTHLSD